MLYLALHMRSLYAIIVQNILIVCRAYVIHSEFDQKMKTVLRRLWMKRLRKKPMKG
jgi:hypothetical protein